MPDSPPIIKEVCIPQASAYFYLTLVMGTLLFVGVVEYLNGRRIERLMAILDEIFVVQDEDGSSGYNDDGGRWDERGR
jgi:hypothetical protein